LSGGKVMLTARADSAPAGPDARPGAIWAEVRPSLRWPAAVPGRANGTDFAVDGGECAAALASGMAEAFEWSKDFSLAWGSEFARNWSASLARFKKASSMKPAGPKGATRAAAVVLNRGPRLAEAARTSSAANFQNMAFPVAAAAGKSGPNGGGGYKGRKGNCGCESSCGWGDLNTFQVGRGRRRRRLGRLAGEFQPVSRQGLSARVPRRRERVGGQTPPSRPPTPTPPLALAVRLLL
jgi:hypothetical protein